MGRLLRESTQAAAALSEKASADVRLLAEKVSALQAATNHDSAERDVVKVLEAQLGAAHGVFFFLASGAPRRGACDSK